MKAIAINLLLVFFSTSLVVVSQCRSEESSLKNQKYFTKVPSQGKCHILLEENHCICYFYVCYGQITFISAEELDFATTAESIYFNMRYYFHRIYRILHGCEKILILCSGHESIKSISLSYRVMFYLLYGPLQ